MQKRTLAALALVPAVLLFGCGSSASNAAAQAENGTDSQEAAQQDPYAQNSTAFTALQRSSGWNYGGYAQDGFYFVSPTVRDDGSTNLMYLDYAAMQTICLCNQPNCNHNTEACTSYLPYSAGGILSCVVGEQLILVFPGNAHAAAGDSAAVLPHMEVMGLDGSGRKTTIPFEASQQINRPLVTDGTNLYCELDTVTEDGNLNAELIRVNPGAGTKESVSPLNQEWVKGCAGSRLILLDANGCYTAYDPATGEREVILTVNNASVDSLLQDTTLAYKENGSFHLLDLTSGKTTALGGFEVPGSEEAFVNLVDADSTHLLFKVETASHQSGANLEDGYYMVTGDAAPRKWELLYDSGEQQMPFERVTAVSGNRYLVIAGEAALPEAITGSQYITTGEKQYVLMTQEEYWNGAASATVSASK